MPMWGRARFVVTWVIASVFGRFLWFMMGEKYAEPILFVGYLLFPLSPASLFAVFATEGALLGWLQARVLRHNIPSIDGWVRATALGTGAAYVLISLVSVGLKQQLRLPGGRGRAVAIALGALAGAVGGVWQWRLLRRHSRRAATWLGVGAVGGVLFLVKMLVGEPSGLEYFAAELARSSLSGVALGWIMMDRQPTYGDDDDLDDLR